MGQRIGQYLVTGKIAEGGMGVVYMARQERPDREALQEARGDRLSRPLSRPG